jgi:hypothetical protein
MSAYHNADWAECYDLWVRFLFGTGPMEDIPVFASILSDIVASNLSSSPTPTKNMDLETSISIADIGTGSGRVLICLQDAIMSVKGRVFQVWGLEPSAAMLDRAKRFWGDAIERKKKTEIGWDEERLMAHWHQCSATNFAEELLKSSYRADLVIFAAGGLSHLIADEEILEFLRNVEKVLSLHGRAVISVLKDFIPSTASVSWSTVRKLSTTVHAQGSQRIPSVDHPGIIYVKYPTTDDLKDGIKTERFRLDVEEGGKVLRSRELCWDAKMFEREKFEEMVREAGLIVREVRKGEIQIWYVLESYGVE